jgi:hypothetical protein
VDTDDLTQIRIAENQATFRRANEQIEAAATKLGIDGRVPFICECPDETCTEIVLLERSAYEEVRRHARRFFTAPGHERLSVDAGAAEVAGRQDGHVVVDKIGVAGEVAAGRSREAKA